LKDWIDPHCIFVALGKLSGRLNFLLFAVLRFAGGRMLRVIK
jgi:hypothetical protein